MVLNFEQFQVNKPLLTKFKFGLWVSSIWSPGSIEKLTMMKRPTRFPKGSYWKPDSYILDFVLDEEPESEKFELKLFCFNMSLFNKFYIEKYILWWLNKVMLVNPCTNFSNKIMLGNPCTNFSQASSMLTVKFEKNS